jgi:cation/acetate symporter
VAQYCVLIFAFTVPAIFIAIQLTDNPIPQLGFGAEVADEQGGYLLDRLDGMEKELGFASYTEPFPRDEAGKLLPGKKSMIDIFCIALALMVGTAGLPHVIVRFYTVKKVKAARVSAFWALLFIAILYTTAPAVSVFARTNLLKTIPGTAYSEIVENKDLEWFRNWENSGLIAWVDRDKDGAIDYAPGKVFEVKRPEGMSDEDAKSKINKSPIFAKDADGKQARGEHGQRLVTNDLAAGKNELYVDRDIMVLANPEIARLPNWVIALVAAGGLAAALSTAAGLLLVISTSFAHDFMKRIAKPDLSEKGELLCARIAAGFAVVIAGLFGVFPPDYVAAVVAFAFGLAASSFFPIIILGIFWKRMNKEGAISGMITGITFTTAYIVYFKFINPGANNEDNWFFGVSPEGIGTIGMLINFAVSIVVSKLTSPPPQEVLDMVDRIRQPGDT